MQIENLDGNAKKYFEVIQGRVKMKKEVIPDMHIWEFFQVFGQ